MDRMLDTHARMKRCMLHDRTARVLCEALSRRGELNRSAGLLDAYLAHERRSSPRPPTALLLLQARLRGSHECRA
jgi:hypothetical protein